MKYVVPVGGGGVVVRTGGGERSVSYYIRSVEETARCMEEKNADEAVTNVFNNTPGIP